MISVFLFTAVAALLLLLLFFVGRGDEAADDIGARAGVRNRSERRELLCPPEIVRRIFSRGDLEFIAEQGSSGLLRVYRAERASVASHWVRQTATALREIMHDHAVVSRNCPNLEVSGEMKLFFQYVELRLLCGFLLIFVGLAGPDAVASLATYASTVSHRIDHAQQEFAAAKSATSAEGLGSF